MAAVRTVSTQTKFVSPLLCFAIGGFLLNIAIAAVWMIGDLVWVDFVHSNPNRSQSNALEMMALSPLYGFIFALLGSWFPLLAGTVAALTAHWIWGRVPFFSLFVMLPLCVYAMRVQGLWLFPPDEPAAFDYWQLLWLSRQQLPVLVGCWWCSNRSKTDAPLSN
jgi:MFS family permease